MNRRPGGRDGRRRAAEALKNLLIALLVVSAVFLGWASRLFGNTSVKAAGFSALFSPVTRPPAATQDISVGNSDCAMPVTIAVTVGAKSHYGVKYDLVDLRRVFAKTITVIYQALGSAQTPRGTDKPTWENALQSLGVYYEYATPVKLSVLAGLYGTSAAGAWGDIAVRRLCVTFSGGRNRLFFQNAADGGFYTAETVQLDDIAKIAASVGINSAIFAFELREGASPYVLLMPESSEHPVMQVKNPLSDAAVLRDTLLYLGVSELSKASYTVGTTTVYVGDDFTLYLTGDGSVTWTAKEGAPAGAAVSESRAVALACGKVAETVGSRCGKNAAVLFSTCRVMPDGAFVVQFRYVADGGAVSLRQGGRAASVTVRGGAVTNLALNYRSFAGTGDSVVLLPEIQAAAAADGDFMLGFGYGDSATGSLTPSWIALPLNP